MNFRSKALPITLSIIVVAGLGVSLVVFIAFGIGGSLGKGNAARVLSTIDRQGTPDAGRPGPNVDESVLKHRSKPEQVSSPVAGNSTSGPKSPAFFNDDPDRKITAILEGMSLEHGWSERTLFENKALWEPACEVVKDYADTPMNADELARLDARMLASKRLGAICRYLYDEVELALLDAFLGDGVNDDANQAAVEREIKSALEFSSREEAMRLAGLEITAALKRDDEALVHRIISMLAFDDDVLNPFLNSKLNYLPAYRNVTREVTSALMCEWNGGCIGDLHPYVLRQCVNKFSEVGAFCHRPENIEQAVYQTLTPLEFAAYNSFLNQLRSHLTNS